MTPVTLPRFDWFCPNLEQPWTFNIYSGSKGTEPGGGCIENPSFNFKVKIKVEDGQPNMIHAAFYIRPPWPRERDPKRSGEKLFDCTPEGLEEAAAWLSKEAEDLYVM